MPTIGASCRLDLWSEGFEAGYDADFCGWHLGRQAGGELHWLASWAVEGGGPMEGEKPI